MATVSDTGGRRFAAFARPQGYPDLGLPGAVVEIHERPDHGAMKLRVLTRPEAAQLHAELGAALRAFSVGAVLVDPPRAYTGPYPIRGKTLAEVDGIAQGEAA